MKVAYQGWNGVFRFEFRISQKRKSDRTMHFARQEHYEYPPNYKLFFRDWAPQ